MSAKSHFRELNVRLFVHLMPCYAQDIQAGINEHLNKLLMKYSEELEGVVIAYHNVKPRQAKGVIIADYPQIHFHVSATLLMFCPRVGSKLVGQVEKVGVDHIGLLVYGIFNAAIPRDAMAKNLECDGEQEYWYDMNNPQEQIRVGSVLQFTVTRLETSQEILAIQGSLAKEDEDSQLASRSDAAVFSSVSHGRPSVFAVSKQGKSKNARTASEANADDSAQENAGEEGATRGQAATPAATPKPTPGASNGEHSRKKARLEAEDEAQDHGAAEGAQATPGKKDKKGKKDKEKDKSKDKKGK